MADQTDPLRGGSLCTAVFLTGASGFVGGYVTRELVRRGFLPVCLARDRAKLRGRLGEVPPSAYKVIRGDLNGRDWFEPLAAADCKAAIHLVGIILQRWRGGQTFRRVHVAGTRTLLEACEAAGITRTVHMSALGARPDAASEYHRTKHQAEQLVRTSTLRWTIFRPSIIHGPDGEFMQMMKYFATSKLRQPVMPYFGRGENLVQPVSVRDVAYCFVQALINDATVGKTYELGGPERYSWKQLYDVCATAIRGRPKWKMSVPVPLAKLLARTIMPLRVPPLTWLIPYPFNAGQVAMSQEESVCDTATVERTFKLKLRSFREELSQYTGQIR